MHANALEPVRLPDEVWDLPATVEALRERRVGSLFRLAKKHAGASQTRIANVTGMDQSEVSRIMKGGRLIGTIEVLERVARGLSMPDRARLTLGLAPTAWPAETPRSREPNRPASKASPKLEAFVPLTELTGRQHDVDTVAALLAKRRVLTLVGAPGIGKTRLSLAAADAVAHRFRGGVVFVPLAEAVTTDDVLATLVRALQVPEEPGQPRERTLAVNLAGREVLLVLDNFEQVLDAAPVVSRLVAGTSGVRALVTSRERLRVTGEQVYAVPPLSLPGPDTLRERDPASAARAVASSTAMQLFATRASAVAAGFVVDEGSARAVAELCHRLDGLPLAIELAAARVVSFTPQELLADLAERLGLISDGPRDVPERQQALHTAIAWSFALLGGEEQRLFRQLSVFSGGFDADAAVAVAAATDAGQPRERVMAMLAALVEKNLVCARPDAAGRTRYALLETIRVFAATALAESGDADAARAGHAAHYALFAAAANAELMGADQALWIDQVDREYNNLQAALGWALDTGRVEDAGRIATDLLPFWWRGRDVSGGRRWYARVLDHADRLGARLRLRVFNAAGHLACWQSDLEPARDLAGRYLAGAIEARDSRATASAQNLVGLIDIRAGDYARARTGYEACLRAWRELGDARGVAVALANLGDLAFRSGDLAAAATVDEEALHVFTELGDTAGVALCLFNIGEIRLWRGEAEAARSLLTRALATSREAGDLIGEIRLWRGEAEAARSLLTRALATSREAGDLYTEACAVDGLGRLAAIEGCAADARRLCADALELRRATGEQQEIPESLQTLAGLALTAVPSTAVALLGAADALRQRLGLAVAPVYQPGLDAHLADLRARCGSDAFTAAWIHGQNAPLEEIIAEALAWAREPVAAGRPSPVAREGGSDA